MSVEKPHLRERSDEVYTEWEEEAQAILMEEIGVEFPLPVTFLELEHLLRTPLTVLSGYIDMLRSEEGLKEETRYLMLDVMAVKAEQMNLILSYLRRHGVNRDRHS